MTPQFLCTSWNKIGMSKMHYQISMAASILMRFAFLAYFSHFLSSISIYLSSSRRSWIKKNILYNFSDASIRTHVTCGKHSSPTFYHCATNARGQKNSFRELACNDKPPAQSRRPAKGLCGCATRWHNIPRARVQYTGSYTTHFGSGKTVCVVALLEC